jgi:hypothetical protein
MMGGLVVLGMLGNSKTAILLPALIYVASVAAFRARIRWQTVLAAVLALAFLSEFLFPAVHIVRSERSRASPIEMGSLTLQAVWGLMTGDSETLAEKDNLGLIQRSSDLYRNVYFGSQQVWLDRFTNTGYIDAVARRMNFDGPFLGIEPVVGNTFYSVLPRVLNPSKYDSIQTAAGDGILQAYGLQTEHLVGYATVPLPIELFAAGGFWAIFLVGIPLVFLMVFDLNLFVFDFRENPWAVCFIIYYAMSFYAQTHDGFSLAGLRQMPFDFFVMTFGATFAAMLKRGFQAAAHVGAAPGKAWP